MTTLLQRLILALSDNDLCDIRELITQEMKQRPLRTTWLTAIPETVDDRAALMRFFMLDRNVTERDALRLCTAVNSGEAVNMKYLTLDAFDRLSRIPGVVLRLEL